ncbi:MAG: hypothetical protein HPY82_08375 [Gammaproteobacteria bacterium]|nr:hypothetical protein [Gammaproteobacteria bacterium]
MNEPLLYAAICRAENALAMARQLIGGDKLVQEKDSGNNSKSTCAAHDSTATTAQQKADSCVFVAPGAAGEASCAVIAG